MIWPNQPVLTLPSVRETSSVDAKERKRAPLRSPLFPFFSKSIDGFTIN